MLMKVQRNEYITFMLIYATVALTAYLWVLDYMYDKREKYESTSKNADEKAPVEKTV